MHHPRVHINNSWILSKRGVKNKVDPTKPYAYLVEKERMPDGSIEDVATVFLTNKECPFRCLMCDLWKNTTDQSVADDSIPRQIEFALHELPATKHIKLYNSGNFFDPKAIPTSDYDAIIELTRHFATVLVENHPRLTNHKVLDFRDRLKTDLQIALGLETVHPEVLPLLNKQMTLEDFRKSLRLLSDNAILARAFILLRPPFLTEQEGIEWAKKSIEFAFEIGVECSAVIPTRAGNGAMEILEKEGDFQSPQISSLEEVLEYGISLQKGRVLADLWDLEYFSTCSNCLEERQSRLDSMNLYQEIYPEIKCNCTN